MEPTFHPLGDSAVVAVFGDAIRSDVNERIRQFCAVLDRHPFPGMIEYVPAFTNVTIFYNPVEVTYEEAEGHLRRRVTEVGGETFESERIVEIPVCYGGEFGPDLEEVAEYHGLSPSEVIELHTAGTYSVYMVGFAPGFPFLGGLSERLATPRRSTPRTTIPAGTVGIGGSQTGVYPIETPGGWRLIGRTPTALFRPLEDPPTLLRAGDIVKFVAIDRADFQRRLEVNS